MSNTPENNFKLGGNLTEWHSTGRSPGSVPSLAFLLSISSIFFSARSMCVCLVVIEFVMLSIFWAGWVVVSAAFFVSRVPSMSNTPRITSNLGVISRNGIPLGSFLEVFPALHVSFLFLQSSFSKKHVCMFGCHWFWHVLCIFWAGWVVVPNGIPLGSLLEAFPALHSSFLFLPSSSQQEACIYVLSAVVCGTLRGKWPIYLIEVNA